MSDPVRLSNPGAESLGFLSNGEEVMAIYVDSRPPSVTIFNGSAPSWSSFGNKTSWGSHDFVDDSPTKWDKEQRDKEIKDVKDKIDVTLNDNANKIASTKQKLIKATENKTTAENELRDSKVKGNNKEILGKEINAALANLNEHSLKTEMAGYEAFKIHGEARKLFADADSLRIGSREANELLKKANAKEQEAKNADKTAEQMKNEYDQLKKSFDNLLSNSAASSDSDLTILKIQQNQLLNKQVSDNDLVKTASQNLINAKNSLDNSNKELRNAEKNLNDKRNTPEGKTITSPENNPIKTSTKHQIYVKDPMFAGRMDITTEAEIKNSYNMEYLLSHSGLDYKRNILNDRNPVVTEDVEGDTAIYNAEVAEWDKLRNRLVVARDQISNAQKIVDAAKSDVQKKINGTKQAQNELNKANANKSATQNNLEKINQKIKEEKQKQEDLERVKDAVKTASGFFNTLYSKYGENQGKIAQELAEAAKGQQLRSIDNVIKSYGTFNGNFDKLYSDSDRKAISYKLNSVDKAELAKNLKVFGKAFGLVDKTIDGYDLVVEFKKANDTKNWRPFFVKAESIFAGYGAGWLTAWSFSIILGTPLGVLGFAVIMAAVGALVNEKLIESINKTIGI